jgi:pseudouridine-5'-phosphate glycosidase
MKASRRDLAFACVTKNNAATTVSATMILAHYAGIHIFATGGIGIFNILYHRRKMHNNR